jgi:hypothetical protein
MRTYVKKNGKLNLVGEGRLYSKRDLILREQDNGDSNTITLTNNSEGGQKAAPNEIKNDARKELQAVNTSKEKQFSVEPREVAGVNAPVQTNTSNVTPPTATVSITDPRVETIMANNAKNGITTNLQQNSVNPRKVMDEMRMNSVPFTKRELSSLLKGK